MKKFIIFLLIFISTFAIAQEKGFQYKIWVGKKQYEYLKTHYVDGTINLINGETIGGLINRDFTEPTLKLIDGDTTTYEGHEIIDFKLKDQSKVISAIINGKHKFLQELPVENGLIKVYTYDLILIENKESAGSNYFANPIEYNKIVEIYFEKNGVYKNLTTNDDVYQLIGDNKTTMDYIEKLGKIELTNLNKIIHIIEFYNISTN